ncbi:MAG: prolipoprotein diacylglyceryl transferase [Longimicrobiales bacterium]
MYPELFRIGDFVVTTFGLMMFLSFVSAAMVCGRQLERYGYPRELAWDVLAWVAIGGIVGAKIYYLALHWQDLAADPLGELTSRGGLVWYGGLLGGVLAYYLQIRKKKLPVALMFDATAPALALAYAVGRMGCFLVGDDYGMMTDSWVGIAFPEGSPPSTAGYLRSLGQEIPTTIPNDQVVPVHPTQLYEIGAALVMFGILWKVGGRRLRQGQLFALYMMLYGIERFGIEFVRAKSDRILLGLSTSSLASLLLLAAGAYLWYHRRTAAPSPVGGRTAATPPASRNVATRTG